MVAYSFKKRFVPRIRAGLGLPDLEPVALPKLQTIRALGKRRHARPGETLQLYTAMRTKQCAKIGDARCISVEPVALVPHVDESLRAVQINGGPVTRAIGALDIFARLDGFDDWADLVSFWQTEHPAVRMFEGVLIRWEPLP